MYKEAEHTILEGCRNQDRKAQEQLYRNYYKAMMNICLRYTRDDNEAMSVLNFAFYKVFKNINRYDPRQANLYTWIRTIVVNSCIDQVRTNKREINTSELNMAAEKESEPEAILKMKEENVLRLVRTLPPATQAVFNLYAMEGYGHKEIAEMLKISEGTSKWHYSEAKKKLKVLLLQEMNKSE